MIPLTASFVNLWRGILMVILIILGVGVAGRGAALVNYFRSKRGKPYFGRIAGHFIEVLSVGLLLCVICALFVSFEAVIAHMPKLMTRIVLGTLAILGLSGIMFSVKQLALRTYALIEGAFACGVCMQTLAGMNDSISPLQGFSLVASAYLFIRAMDNFKKDLDERGRSKSVQSATS